MVLTWLYSARVSRSAVSRQQHVCSVDADPSTREQTQASVALCHWAAQHVCRYELTYTFTLGKTGPASTTTFTQIRMWMFSILGHPRSPSMHHKIKGQEVHFSYASHWGQTLMASIVFLQFPLSTTAIFTSSRSTSVSFKQTIKLLLDFPAFILKKMPQDIYKYHQKQYIQFYLELEMFKSIKWFRLLEITTISQDILQGER